MSPHATPQPPLVVHIINHLIIGGMENGLVNLINRTPTGRYRHAIICLKGFSDFRLRLNDQAIPVIALNKRDGKDLGVNIKLWRVLRQLRPDIVHTRNLCTLDSIFASALAGVPHRIHGEHGWDMIDLYGKNRKYNMLRRVCRPFIGHYIALSQDLQTWLREQVGVSDKKLVHIYNGVDIAAFRPGADGVRQPLPIADFAQPDTVVIGNVGRMQAVKDPLNLVRAFIHLLESVPQAHARLRLVMIGDGPLQAEAQSLLQQAGAAHLAWLPGARNDIPELLRTMDIFVLPSLNEGISNTILEAMASGLPVVATQVGGNPELVTQGATGFIVAPSDPLALAEKIALYLRDPELMRRHGQAGRTRVERDFSLEVMIGHYLAVYDRALGKKTGMAALADIPPPSGRG